jgi:hypothetical protein
MLVKSEKSEIAHSSYLGVKGQKKRTITKTRKNMVSRRARKDAEEDKIEGFFSFITNTLYSRRSLRLGEIRFSGFAFLVRLGASSISL